MRNEVRSQGTRWKRSRKRRARRKRARAPVIFLALHLSLTLGSSRVSPALRCGSSLVSFAVGNISDVRRAMRKRA